MCMYVFNIISAINLFVGCTCIWNYSILTYFITDLKIVAVDTIAGEGEQAVQYLL